MQGQNRIDNGGARVYDAHTSFVKCFEQDTTSPDHRFQRAVGGAKRQQGTGWPSPVSSRSERQHMPSNCRRFPSVNRVRSPIDSGSGRAAGHSGKQGGNAEVEICGAYRRVSGLRLCNGFSLRKTCGRDGVFSFCSRHWRKHNFFGKEREIV